MAGLIAGILVGIVYVPLAVIAGLANGGKGRRGGRRRRR